MHGGREGEDSSHHRHRRRHMLSASSPPSRAPSVVLVRSSSASSSPFDSSSIQSSADSILKDGRKIRVGDCALFQAGNAPPFIGIIRWFSTGKEDCLKLCVNWLYRPADIKLAKGILLDAAPNEVFYSFHKDVIAAASLLHPCKVAFLSKGVELPPGISSFICRRVYDIANKCLWWLTDQDYINERQEEVDQLLDKTRLEMHAAVQSGGRSPKPLSAPTSTQQLKSGSDSVQNSGSSFSIQANKGKKRERGGDQGIEPIKRERSSNKPEDVESASSRLDNMIKSEVAKFTEKGALVTTEGCEKLVHVMQLNRNEKKIDLAGRILLADMIAGTDKIECLSRIVQLGGVPVLDDWLQEAHKGKTGDSSCPKESDKGTEDLLFALLRALDKLPVNLNALQTCNIGKSVNHLRSHKNLEIQRKARSLVDTWKKRVDAEMTKINDAKSGGPTNQSASWPGKPGFSEVSHSGSKATVKTLISQPPACSKTLINNKPGHVDAILKSTPVTPGAVKLLSSSPLPSSVAVSWKDSPGKGGGGGNYSELPLVTVKEEKSSSSSHSQNNSQSCSSDHAKTMGSSWKEDARSSTAGSLSASKTSGNSSRHRSSNNGFVENSIAGVQNDSNLGKTAKVSNQSGLTSETARDMPGMDPGNNQRLIVRIPNPGRSPAQSTSGGSLEDPSVTESCQSEDVKDGIAGSDEGTGSPPAGVDEGAGRAVDSSSGNGKEVSSIIEPKLRNSLNALIESCAKYSEPSAPLTSGDDIGMNLLASVAAGEMSSKSDLVSVSLSASPGSSPKEEPCAASSEAKSRFSCEAGLAQTRAQSNENADSDSGKPLISSDKLNEISKIEQKSADINREGLESDLVTQSTMDERKPTNHTHEKIGEGMAKPFDLAGKPLGDKCENDILVPGCKPENLVSENSCSSTEEQKPAVTENHADAAERVCGNDSTTSTSDKFPCLETVDVPKSRRSDESDDNHLDPSESVQKELTTSAPNSNEEQAGTTSNRVDNVLEKKEPLENHLVSPVQEAEKCSKSDLRKTEELTSSEQNSIGAKLDFDLNEGFSGDDANQNQTERPTVSLAAPVSSPSIHLPIVSPFASSPAPNNAPVPVTVAAPNKGPFVPPENLLKTRGEPFGWKGSAATSAFRPAEPRKVLEMPPLNTSDAHSSDTLTTKQGRPPLDIDLNVADEMVLEDMASSQSSPRTAGSESGIVSNLDAPTRSAGGLDLDLNKVDEGTDNGQFLASTSSRKPFCGGLHNGEANMLRDFDLNNGPGVDEIISAELLQKSHVKNSNSTMHLLPPIAGLRMGSNAEIGNVSSWFPHANSYPAVAIPSFLHEKGEQHQYPIMAAPGAQRILGSVTGSVSGDFYRGPVLSSSPAMAFSPATPFPYAGFPFGSSFPLPSTSYSGGPTTYVDSSQLVGPGSAVSSHYVRPYVLSLPEGSMNAGTESNRKWVSRGLDLNAGPGSADVVDVKDDRLQPSASRQLPLASSQMFVEEQARMHQVSGGSGVKRKEREGGGSWGDERFYKQHSWQ